MKGFLNFKTDFVNGLSALLKVLALVVCVCIFSCTPRLTPDEPPIPEAEQFSMKGTEALPERWWTVFEDEQLSLLIDSALSGNLDLATSWQRVEESRAIAKRQGSFLLPQVDLNVQSGLSRPEPDFAGGENTQVGLSASYEIDLWGRLRARRDAAGYRLEASLYDYQAAAISLSAEITSAWYQYLTAMQQIQLADEQMEVNEENLKLIRVRFAGGAAQGVDILRQQQLMEATKAQKINFETNAALFKNQLAVLTGLPPQNEIIFPTDSLPELPPLPETGLPLELVRRRPDIKQTYSQVLAADRDLAEAIGNKYPRISILSNAQLRSNEAINIFDNWAYNLGANIFAPIFSGGRLRAEVDRTEALKNQALYQFGQATLVAFREVEDAMVREVKQLEQIAILDKRLELSRRTNNQLRIEFINGQRDYLDLLLSLDQEQQLRRDRLSAGQDLILIRIALYRALAGSFSTEYEASLEE